MAKVKFLKVVTMGSSDLPVGSIDEVDDQSAAALVREGAAEYVEEDSNDDADDEDLEAKAKAQAILDAAANKPTDEEIDMVRKALDAQYKRDELADAAKAVGIEFPYDAKKGDIVEAVLAADKAALLLK